MPLAAATDSSPTTADKAKPLPLPEQPWVAIVANPYSGSGANRRLVGQLSQALEKQGMSTVAFWHRSERDAMLNDPLLARWCCCIVVAGGDGTVGNVLSHRPPVPIAVLPLGNENLLAKEFGFTASIDALAQSILRGHNHRIDLGIVGDRCFSLMLTAGLDADVIHRVAAWRSRGGKMRRIRHWSYVAPFFSSLRNYHYPQITVEADDRVITGCLAMVFNLPRYGLNLPFAPAARGDDALLDYVVFQRPGLLNTLAYLRSVIHQSHSRRPDVVTGRARAIKLSSPARVPIQIDGDPAGHTPADITVLPQAIRVVTV